MLYHVYVEFSLNGRTDDCFEADILSLEDVKKKYVKPYYYRKTFFVNGRVLKSDIITIFKVLQSEVPLENIVSMRNAQIPNNVIMFYTEYDVLKNTSAGLKDITFDLYDEFDGDNH